MADGLAVLDEFIDRRLTLYGTRNGEFCRFIIGPVEISLVEVRIRRAARIEPDHKMCIRDRLKTG